MGLDDNTIFTQEVLQAQDGKKVDVTLENGGPVIGHGVLTYHPERGVLEADLRIDEAKTMEWLMNDPSFSIKKKK